MDRKQLAVVGGGTMGAGIAQVFAQAGYLVDLIDVNSEILKRSLTRMDKSVRKLAEKGAIDPSNVDTVLSSVRAVSDIRQIGAASLVVEAVPESFDLKKRVFQELDAALPPETVLASNTSSISITEIAAATKRPDKVIGMHFMNPVPLMKLVEIIRGIATSDATYERVENLTEELGKTPVEVQDYPGFVSNRVLMPMINEAIYVLMEGVASAKDIDTVMKLGMNHPMGPLTLADFIGLDVCLDIMEVLYSGFSDPKYRPCPLLKKMVRAGYLGRKSGRGFFEYES
ncbi:MAG: 3-hydroxybutyryl-CoA dehydrogenase [Candidatus Latescibacterota bacterium]|nr:MAG: 3-hydroxybutyryl-CoA dehydrogenase [Candidatus Latescibacterota bacterium]